MQLLLDRLNNDITRLAAVKAMEQIALAPLPLPLGGLLGPGMQLLTSFLRKSSRPLRQASISAVKVCLWKIAQLDCRCLDVMQATMHLCQ